MVATKGKATGGAGYEHDVITAVVAATGVLGTLVTKLDGAYVAYIDEEVQVGNKFRYRQLDLSEVTGLLEGILTKVTPYLQAEVARLEAAGG